MTKASEKRTPAGAPSGGSASKDKAACVTRSRLERAARAARGAAKAKLRGGPVDRFDLELIGFVCERSAELGCGYELYELDVAPLQRNDRARLWKALERVLEDEVSKAVTTNERKLRALCRELGIDEDFPDAFTMDRDLWKRKHIYSNAEIYNAAAAADAAVRTRPAPSDLRDASRAIMRLGDALSERGGLGPDVRRKFLAVLEVEKWPSIDLIFAAVAACAPADERARLAAIATQIVEAA